MYRNWGNNNEGYPDPTAWEAIANVTREQQNSKRKKETFEFDIDNWQKLHSRKKPML